MFTGQGSEGGYGDWYWKGWGGTRLLSLSPLPALTTRHVRRPPRHQSPPPVPRPCRPNPGEQR